ncbi:sensor histidine kinase [Fodinicola acaciae]|uniref:sensor histidine kinase n=1 Tax=Fodinicola acaciae TaxID=2681555 RepID=UPI0013D3ED4F|nr:HAMP domain-containing sensor histidine kinase [Fodinicola acaciae]
MANKAYRWIWRLSLRARLTLLATAVLAIGLGAGGTLLVGTVSASLYSSVDTGVTQTSDNIVALVKANQLPVVLPAAPSQYVQVVNARGQVLANSTTADAIVSLLPASKLAAAAAEGKRLSVEEHEPGRDGPMWVQVTAVGSGDDLRYVIVAASIKDAIDGGKVVRSSVGIGFPILLLVLAGLSWMVVGATLRPVESLRRGAAEITGSGGARRLPVPDAHDEVQRLAVTLNDMLSRLEAARDRQRAFVADAAHELRSPLASLRTQLEIAARRSPELSTEDLLAEIDRLSRLVDDLLLLARMDAGMVAPPRSEKVDLAEVARGMAKRHDGVAVTAPDDLPLVTGDRDQLSRVVANLLDNAVRHARTSVGVAVTADDREVVVRVRDDGPGIPAGDRDRVFERFTRLDDARARDDGGVGLGLAIVADLVRAHGGTVTLDDGSPGLVATVRLPAA